MTNWNQNGFSRGAFDSMGNYYPYKSQQHMSAARVGQSPIPALTPAQQHAEELRDTLRNLVDALDNGVRYHAHAVQPMKDAETLLAKIDPPAPPTLEEALQVMQSYTQLSRAGQTHQGFIEIGRKMRDICDRARRAGVLEG